MNQYEYRNQRVREVLLASGKVLGPTEIARRIDEDWCKRYGVPSSSAILLILKRIGAMRHPGGLYSLENTGTRNE